MSTETKTSANVGLEHATDPHVPTTDQRAAIDLNPTLFKCFANRGLLTLAMLEFCSKLPHKKFKDALSALLNSGLISQNVHQGRVSYRARNLSVRLCARATIAVQTTEQKPNLRERKRIARANKKRRDQDQFYRLMVNILAIVSRGGQQYLGDNAPIDSSVTGCFTDVNEIDILDTIGSGRLPRSLSITLRDIGEILRSFFTEYATGLNYKAFVAACYSLAEKRNDAATDALYLFDRIDSISIEKDQNSHDDYLDVSFH